jgi:hypothetical protein
LFDVAVRSNGSNLTFPDDLAHWQVKRDRVRDRLALLDAFVVGTDHPPAVLQANRLLGSIADDFALVSTNEFDSPRVTLVTEPVIFDLHEQESVLCVLEVGGVFLSCLAEALF